MFGTLKNAFKIPDLRRKIGYTLLMFLIIRLGAHIPVPGVDSSVIKQFLEEQGGMFGLFDAISGGAFENMTIFAMGISPYITASIVISLLTVAIPALEELQKEGEEGRKKIAKYTRYGTIVLAAIQGFGTIFGFRNAGLFIKPGLWSYIVALVSLTAGSAFMMWIGEQITEKGIGNGISLIIFINILSRAPQGVRVLLQYEAPVATAILIVLFIIMIAFVVLIQEGERRIAVQYAKRTSGRKVYGGQSTHIPLKVNMSGVMPIIFASSLLQFPMMITRFFIANPTGWWGIVLKWLNINHWFGALLYLLLIIFFSYFYTSITFNPLEVADNMKKSGGFIPGIRPGKPTVQYLTKSLNYITLAGAIFLAIIALAPVLFTVIFKMNISFGGTSLLIVVGVALETVKQMEAQMLMRHYKGFLNS
ncbi:MAG: preprotein translocase subunit SecY [Epulopiscium sp.]|nr:preprotein translocase subunit SecY [Candidatus Epulonipiscium sp.]